MPVYTWSQTASANATVGQHDQLCGGPIAEQRQRFVPRRHGGGRQISRRYQRRADHAHLDRQELTIVFHATSGLNPTLNVDSLGAKALNISTGVAVPNGYFLANTPYRLTFFNATNEFIPQGAAGGPVNDGRTTLASAATVNIGAASAKYIQITGTTTITAFDTIAAGAERVLEFAGSLILTNNATSLMLPGPQR